MINVYIVDDCFLSKNNGISTYISNLTSALNNEDVKISIIKFNSSVSHFLINNENHICSYHIPILNTKTGFVEPELAVCVLKFYIIDAPNNIFIFNFSPCSVLLDVINKYFPASKRIFVIHNQGWASPLLGDENKYKRLIASDAKGDFHKYLKKYYNEECLIYSKADFIICLSGYTRSILKYIYNIPYKKICLIPNGVNIDAFDRCLINDELRMKCRIKEDAIILLYVGRTIESKGFNVLLQSFESLNKVIDNVYLVIAGEISSFNNILEIVPFSISHILFLGHLPLNKLMVWYKIADIGVIPSYSEQCSYVAIEMMLSQLLIVSSDCNGLKEMFVNNYSALVVEIGDRSKRDIFVDNLTSTILKAINLDISIKNTICDNAYKKAIQNYTLATMRSGYYNFINVIMNSMVNE